MQKLFENLSAAQDMELVNVLYNELSGRSTTLINHINKLFKVIQTLGIGYYEAQQGQPNQPIYDEVINALFDCTVKKVQEEGPLLQLMAR